MLEEHDLDYEAIAGTGKDGRITKADVLAYLDQGREASAGIEFDEAAPPAEKLSDCESPRALSGAPRAVTGLLKAVCKRPSASGTEVP